MHSAAGCVFNGTTYEVGAELVQGCEAQCMCHQNGTMTCSERCQYPYFQRGTPHPDPYCSEQAVDECCSLMACEGAADEDRIGGWMSSNFNSVIKFTYF